MFSVIIPVFNHERYLPQAVLSAVGSKLVSEVLLLDDGSTDDSYELVRELSSGPLGKVRDVTPSPRINRGAHACLNSLTHQASSEWVAVLNSDDVFIADRFDLIERKLRLVKADFIFGDLSVIDENGRQLGLKNGPFHPQYPFPPGLSVNSMAANGEWAELLANQNFVATTSNIVFRKSLFSRIGGFSAFRYIHDWDFAIRAALIGKPLYLPHPLTAYRIHSSNTIKESTTKVDREVQAMFHLLRLDFPNLPSNPKLQIALAGNDYLYPFHQPVLTINVPEPELYLSSLDSKVERIGPGGTFIYSPSSTALALRPDHLQNVLLSLAFQDVDFVLVSHSLEHLPSAAISSPSDAIVFRARAQRYMERLIETGPHRFSLPVLRGQLARLLPGTLPVDTLELPFPVLWGATPLEPPAADGIVHLPTGRPVVFILPALFAVGGVERLMVEMMRQLADRYEFVVITVERLSTGHGSLHSEAGGVMLACYDLAELAPATLFLRMMQRLKEIYKPALVWVPNGSPWQCDNALGIREVFDDIPIVDQQAYDTEAGWIARYHEPGIQSYDRFVAINTKIRDVQAGRYGIPPEKIDLIYHSINLDALGPLVRPDSERAAYRVKYNLPASGDIYGWVGRLTRQKRPLEFLQFVKRQPNDHFLMIGNGELAGDCDAFIAENELSNVTVIRFSNTMAELFAVMSGLLSASEYEGLPISMLEAIAMGVPVFSTDVGDVGIILAEYNAGQITPADWDLDRYSADFHYWKQKLPFGAREAAPAIRQRFGGPSVAALYDACFQRALGDRQ